MTETYNGLEFHELSAFDKEKVNQGYMWPDYNPKIGLLSEPVYIHLNYDTMLGTEQTEQNVSTIPPPFDKPS
jgi:hypothetical protein